MLDHIPLRDYWPSDGWRQALPREFGLDADQLVGAWEHLGTHYPTLDSLLVMRGGYLVFERYAEPAGPDTLRNIKSATKSVLSALIGIALRTGDLNSLDDRLCDVLPALFTSADDSARREITIRHLLTMRSGLEWDEWGPNVIEMTANPNWLNYVLDRPLIHDPGTHFNYSTGDTQLLSAVLQQATGITALEFADMYLFAPLGITRRTWPANPQGVTVGGSELSITARDLAKFGYLYLNQGQWEGQTVIPAAWVEESTREQVAVIAHDAGEHPPLGYGYLWWLRPHNGTCSPVAVGYGGQFVYVFPWLDLVVVITGALAQVPAMFADNRMIREFNVVEEYILPAVGG